MRANDVTQTAPAMPQKNAHDHTLRALIFDVDGTLADTELAHMAAFNQAFKEFGLDWHWDQALYTQLLKVSGGKERIQHYWQNHQRQLSEADFPNESINRIHALKTLAYEQLINSGAVQLRDGVLNLIETAHQAGVTLAIATTTTPINIAMLLGRAMGKGWHSYFAVIEDASTAPIKKPHPQVYQQVLQRLQLSAHDCVAFEDSGNGLQAARAAGLQVVITPTGFTSQDSFEGALRCVSSLKNVDLAQLQAWLNTSHT